MSACLCLLTACLKVDDDGNVEVANALEAQNKILAEQTKQLSLTGLVINAIDGKEVSSATITMIVAGETIHDSLVFDGGDFKLDKLPPNTDIEIVVSSADNSFLTRVFFVKTGESNAANTSNDLGTLTVSEPNTVKVTVINKTTGLPFANLEFVAYSHAGNSSSAIKYKHVSSYDDVNGVYSITLPKFIDTSIRANLDLNKDGDIDFIPEVNNNLVGRYLSYSSANTKESFTLYIEEVAPSTEVEYRISLIDQSANALLGATLLATGSDGVESKATYDSATEQYVLSAMFGRFAKIEIPSFTADNIDYQSAVISFNLITNDNENVNVRISGTHENCCFVIPNSNTVELAVKPVVINNGISSLEVTTAANKVNAVDDSFSVFYSQPISLSTSDVSLTNMSGFKVVRGNEDLNDLVLSGTTAVTGRIDTPVTFKTSLNDTRLTITPTDKLMPGLNYEYDVKDVVVKSSKKSVNISGDSLSFTKEFSEDVMFDINDVRVDNHNFTTNGATIITANSAGDTVSSFNNDRSVYLHLPTSIDALQNLSFRLMTITQDGVSVNRIRNYIFVRDGNRLNVQPIGLVRIAENETLVQNDVPVSIIAGSAQQDSQKIYRANTYQYLSDNLSSSKNDLTFEYSYETKAGDVASGIITIPVQ